MSEPTNDPPLVLRVEGGEAIPAPPPGKPRPGFWEAILWCLLFVAVQMFGLIFTALVVFTVYALAAENPQKFLDDQLEGMKRTSEAKTDVPPLPAELSDSLAWGMLAAQCVSLALIAIVLPRRIGPDWKRQLAVRRPHPLHVCLAILVLPGFLVLPDVVQAALEWVTGLKPPDDGNALKGIFGRFPWALTALAISIGPGVVEELWCRGFLGRGLCARYGFIGGVLLTSVFFAAMHMNPALLLSYTCLGVYLHFVYIAARSIWVPILLHAMNNGAAILLALALSPEKLQMGTPVVLWLAAFSLLLFGSVALWTSRAVVQPFTVKHSNTDWKPEYPGISHPQPETNLGIGYSMVSPAAFIFTVVSFSALLYLGYRFLI